MKYFIAALSLTSFLIVSCQRTTNAHVTSRVDSRAGEVQGSNEDQSSASTGLETEQSLAAIIDFFSEMRTAGRGDFIDSNTLEEARDLMISGDTKSAAAVVTKIKVRMAADQFSKAHYPETLRDLNNAGWITSDIQSDLNSYYAHVSDLLHKATLHPEYTQAAFTGVIVFDNVLQIIRTQNDADDYPVANKLINVRDQAISTLRDWNTQRYANNFNQSLFAAQTSAVDTQFMSVQNEYHKYQRIAFAAARIKQFSSASVFGDTSTGLLRPSSMRDEMPSNLLADLQATLPRVYALLSGGFRPSWDVPWGAR